jgi:hypothetical protein
VAIWFVRSEGAAECQIGWNGTSRARIYRRRFTVWSVGTAVALETAYVSMTGSCTRRRRFD